MEKSHFKNFKLIATITTIVTCIAIAIYMVINTVIADSTKVVDESKVTSVVDINLEKYVNYNLENKKGSLVQLDVQTGIEFKEGQEHVPLSGEGILVNAPKINDKLPESVEVIEKTTNENSDAKNFKYEYDSATGEIKIAFFKVEDKNNFSIILNYDENCYTEEKVKRELNVSATVQSILATSQNVKIQKSIEKKIEVEKDVSNLLSNNIKTSEVYNGFIKQNAKKGSKYKTEYREDLEISISKAQISDETKIKVGSNFVKDGEKLNTEDILYTLSSINKNNVLDILGENGSLKILDKDGKLLAEINKDTQVEEDGTYNIEYKQEASQLFIVFSKPEKAGYIEIKNKKQIKETVKDSSIDKIQISSQIKATNKVKVESNDENTENNENEQKVEEKQVYAYDENKVIEIKDSKTEVKLIVDNAKWTNQKQNTVNFNVELLASESKQNLFKDPVINIKLPDEVEKVILDEAKFTYGNGLTLKEVKYNKDSKIIKISLNGEQTEYLQKNLANGTNIVIPATVILGEDIESKEENVKISYKNNATDEIGKDETTISIKNFKEDTKKEETETPSTQITESAKVSTTTEKKTTKKAQVKNVSNVKTSNAIATINVEDEKITAQGISMEVTPIRGDVILKNGDTVYEGEYIKYEIKVTNTTKSTLNNVKIAGTVPDGLTYGELVREDEESGVESYHKFNENLKIVEQTIESLDAGATKNFYYEVQVNDLAENTSEKEIKTNIKAYINNNLSAKYDITHKIAKAEYKVYLSANIYHNKEFQYRVTVIGNLTEEATVKVKIPKGLKVWDVTKAGLGQSSKDYEESTEDNSVILKIDPDDYMPKETLLKDTKTGEILNETDKNKYKYTLFMKLDEGKIQKSDETSRIEVKSVATLNDKYKSNENRLLIGYEEISISMSSETEGEKIRSGEEINYEINISNIGRDNYKSDGLYFVQLVLTDYLPKNLEDIKMTYNNFELDSETKEFKENEFTANVAQTINDDNISTTPNIELHLNIPYKETVKIKIKAKAARVYDVVTINNMATVSQEVLKWNNGDETLAYDATIATQNSKVITHTILPLNYEEGITNPTDPTNPTNPTDPTDPTNPTDPTDPTNPTNPTDPTDPTNPTDSSNQSDSTNSSNQANPTKTYSISGIAWIDANTNGGRDNNEKLLSGIETILLDSNGNIKETVQTNSNGKYTFSNLSSGKYVVVFKYDTAKYRLTEYKKSGINDKINSDFIKAERNIQGKNIICGVTDLLNLNSNLTNIDIGFLENKKVDFEIKNYVQKVTVKTSKNTKENSYNNINLAKAEIKSKEIDGAIVTVEYKIVITNNGEIAGTVDKIIDTLPEGFNYSGSLWTPNKDGKIENTSLANQKIQPGKSVELSIKATKTMSANSVGTYTNKVQIESSSNEFDIQDTNIQNDSSQSDLIISISTGLLVYTSIIIIVMSIILIILNAKFNILRKIRFRLLMLGILLLVICLSYGNIETSAAGTEHIYDTSTKFTKDFFIWSSTRKADMSGGNEGDRYRDSKKPNGLGGYGGYYISSSETITIYNHFSGKSGYGQVWYLTLDFSANGNDPYLRFEKDDVNGDGSKDEWRLFWCDTTRCFPDFDQGSGVNSDFWYWYENYVEEKFGDKNKELEMHLRNPSPELNISGDWRAFAEVTSGCGQPYEVATYSNWWAGLCIDEDRESGLAYINDTGTTPPNDGSDAISWTNTTWCTWHSNPGTYYWKCTGNSSNDFYNGASYYKNQTRYTNAYEEIISTNASDKPNLELTPSSDIVKYKKINSDTEYVFGPLSVNSNKTYNEYNFYIQNVLNGKEINANICDVNGNILGTSPKGNINNFYLKVSTNALKSLGTLNSDGTYGSDVKIRIRAYSKITFHAQYEAEGEGRRIFNPEGWTGQRVAEYDTTVIIVDEDKGDEPFPKECYWETKGSLKIKKCDQIGYDEAGSLLSMQDIYFVIYNQTNGKWLNKNGDSYFYSDTIIPASHLVTDSSGLTEEIDNLDAGNYYAYEIISDNDSGIYDLPKILRDYYEAHDKISGYDYNVNKFEIQVENGRLQFINPYTITNYREYIAIQINKKDELYKPINFKGKVKFKLYWNDKNQWVKTEDTGIPNILRAKNYVNNWGDASELTLDSSGNSKIIRKLKPGTYTVYEYDISSDLGYYYEAKTTSSSPYIPVKIKYITDNNIDAKLIDIESVNGLFKISPVNKRDFISVRMHKQDSESPPHSLEDVRYKILDVTANKWIRVDRRNNYEYYSVTTNYKTDDVDDVYSSTFKTDSTGYTPVIKKLPRYDGAGNPKTYKIYEVSFGELNNYDSVYRLGSFSYEDTTYTGKLVATIECTDTNEIATCDYSDSSTDFNIRDKGEYTDNIFNVCVVKDINKQYYGALQLHKIDEFTEAPMEGIGFKIYNDVNGWLQIGTDNKVIENDTRGQFKDATTIYTNSDGWTDTILKLPLYNPGGSYMKYKIYEVEIKGELQNYFTLDDDYKTNYIAKNESEAKIVADNVTLTPGIINSFPFDSSEITQEEFKNTQSYITLKGRVWEDGEKGKNEKTINNRFDNDDNYIKNIYVRVMYIDPSTSTKTVAYTEDVDGSKSYKIGYTNEQGEYEFTKVRIDRLQYYEVQFSYDGITYQAIDDVIDTTEEYEEDTDPTLGGRLVTRPSPNTSKAKESGRDTLNGYFKEITGYDEGNYQSINGKNIKYGKISTYPNRIFSKNTCEYYWKRIDPTTGHGLVTLDSSHLGDFKIIASVPEGKIKEYYDTMFSAYQGNGITLYKEIPNLNLGVYRREVPDLALSKDIYSAQVAINKYNYTYKYEKDIDTLSDDYKDLETKVGVSFKRKTAGATYKTPIHRADAAYELNDDETTYAEGELKVSIIYRIGLINDSRELYTKVNSIKEYYSEDFGNLEGVYSDPDCKNRISNVDISTPTRLTGYKLGFDTASNNYKVSEIKFNNPIELEKKGGGCVKYIYIKLDLPKDKFWNFDNVNHKILDIYGDKEFKNNAEISSFSVYSDNTFSTRYAAFDYDSVPNTITGKAPSGDSYRDLKNEDDSDFAPGLKIQEAAERTISGVVFEDKQSDDSKRTNERYGDGVKEDDDNLIQGVTVQLVPAARMSGSAEWLQIGDKWVKAKTATKQEIIDYYENRWLGEDHSESELTVTTDENGQFKLTGLIPGDYWIRYMWGRSESTAIISVDESGKTIRTPISAGEYKSTQFDSAMEDYTFQIDGNGINESSWYLNKFQRIPRFNNKSEANDDWGTRTKFDSNRPTSYYDYNTYNVYEDDIMYSFTRQLYMGIEINEENPGSVSRKVLDPENPIYYYNIGSIDLGLIERPKQKIELDKKLDRVRIIDNQDRVVVDAEVVTGEDGKRQFKNLKDVLYTVYLPQSETNAFGESKSEMDKDYLPAKLEATYTLTVKNTGEKDYKNKNYYIYVHQKEEWDEDPVRIAPTGVYDYLSKQFDITYSSKEHQVTLKNGFTTQSKDHQFISEDDYKTKLKDTINKKSALYAEGSTKTIIEAGYEDYKLVKDFTSPSETTTSSDGTTTISNSWEKEYKTLASAYEEWYYKSEESKTVRQVKLGDDKILKIPALEKPLAAEDENTYTYVATALIENSTGSGIELFNDAEIVDIDRYDDYGKTIIETYKPLYYRGEDVVVTSPTGGHSDDAPIDTDTRTLIISIASALAVLSIGIIFIKKKVINKKHKKN